MRMVTSKKECEDAAVFLKLTDKSARDNKNTKIPPGCIYHMLGYASIWLGWAPLTNYEEPSIPCGIMQFGYAFNCICASKTGKRFNSKIQKKLIIESEIYTLCSC